MHLKKKISLFSTEFRRCSSLHIFRMLPSNQTLQCKFCHHSTSFLAFSPVYLENFLRCTGWHCRRWYRYEPASTSKWWCQWCHLSRFCLLPVHWNAFTLHRNALYTKHEKKIFHIRGHIYDYIVTQCRYCSFLLRFSLQYAWFNSLKTSKLSYIL